MRASVPTAQKRSDTSAVSVDTAQPVLTMQVHLSR